MKSNNYIVDFENSIAPWLGKTVKVVEYHLHEAFSDNGIDITKEQFIVLKKLHDQDGLNQNELALLVFRNKSSLTRLLSKMEKKKYIIRKQSEQDKRINNVYLTDLGKDIFIKTQPILKKIIARLEQQISPDEKQQMLETLKKIQRNFNQTSSSL